jgi:hypothetical protein
LIAFFASGRFIRKYPILFLFSISSTAIFELPEYC